MVEENVYNLFNQRIYIVRAQFLTGICDAGSTPILLSSWLSDRLLFPSTLPRDSPKPNSSPTLKPIQCKFGFMKDNSFFKK